MVVRSHFGLGLPADAQVPDQAKHKFSIALWGAVCRGGVYVMSIYPWTSEGMSERNLDLLQAVAGAIFWLYVGLRGEQVWLQQLWGDQKRAS